MKARSVQARRPAVIPEPAQAAADDLPAADAGARARARDAFPIVMITLGLAGSAAWVILLLWMIAAVAVDSWS